MSLKGGVMKYRLCHRENVVEGIHGSSQMLVPKRQFSRKTRNGINLIWIPVTVKDHNLLDLYQYKQSKFLIIFPQITTNATRERRLTH